MLIEYSVGKLVIRIAMNEILPYEGYFNFHCPSHPWIRSILAIPGIRMVYIPPSRNCLFVFRESASFRWRPLIKGTEFGMGVQDILFSFFSDQTGMPRIVNVARYDDRFVPLLG